MWFRQDTPWCLHHCPARPRAEGSCLHWGRRQDEHHSYAVQTRSVYHWPAFEVLGIWIVDRFVFLWCTFLLCMLCKVLQWNVTLIWRTVFLFMFPRFKLNEKADSVKSKLIEHITDSGIWTKAGYSHTCLYTGTWPSSLIHNSYPFFPSAHCQTTLLQFVKKQGFVWKWSSWWKGSGACVGPFQSNFSLSCTAFWWTNHGPISKPTCLTSFEIEPTDFWHFVKLPFSFKS